MHSYSPHDIFNADYAALFFKLLPKCTGSERSKEHVTVMAAAKHDGDEEAPPFVIGKSLRPPCFRNIRSLPTDYAANSKASMASELFKQSLRKLDRKFKLRNQRVPPLIVDDC